MSDNKELIERLRFGAPFLEGGQPYEKDCQEYERTGEEAATALEQADARIVELEAKNELCESIGSRNTLLIENLEARNVALAAQVVTMQEALKYTGLKWSNIVQATELSTAPASEVLAEHDAKVVERCAKDAERYRFFKLTFNSVMPNLDTAIDDAIRALIAAPKENSNGH